MKLIDYYNDTSQDVTIEEIGKAGTGYNSPTLVKVNGVLGYKKKSVNCASFDAFEYLISILGKELKIKTADTYFFDDGSIFSKAINPNGEEFITYSDIIKSVSISQEEIAEKIRRDKELEPVTFPNGKVKYMLKTDEDIEYGLGNFIKIIKKMNLEDECVIKRHYIRMCFLDSLTGNKDRVSNNYGLLKNEDNYSFAPLFDSSTIAYPGIDDNLVQINDYLIDRDDLKKFILKKYPQYLDDMLSIDMNKVKDKLYELADKVLNDNDKEWFNSQVTDQLPTDLTKEIISLYNSDESEKNR